MFSWRRPVAMLASCLRRNSWSADFVRIVLSATRSATPSLFFSASSTMPMPPRPISPTMVYVEEDVNFRPDRSTKEVYRSEGLVDLHRGARLALGRLPARADAAAAEALQEQL